MYNQVYFIYNHKTKLIKIGQTSNIQLRVKNLEMTCGTRLALVAIAPNYGATSELTLHKKFDQYRLWGLGEWFRFSPAIKDFIVALADSKVDDGVTFQMYITECGREIISKMKFGMLGNHHSIEAREKMRLAKLGIPKSPQHRANLSAAMLRKIGSTKVK